ncbi:hypothetical protein ABTX15_31365 [Micromonospora sp. NPDC094482]|uniref:Mu transposase domain-containing protein n=1 Tax=unclassified Micromonospora TaxID=2617518 RepID=UPI0033318960
MLEQADGVAVSAGKVAQGEFLHGGGQGDDPPATEGIPNGPSRLAPVRLFGQQVNVHLQASDLVVFDGRTEVARHERLMAKARSRLNLDHYLGVRRMVIVYGWFVVFCLSRS